MTPSHQRRQSGAALLITMLILIALAFLGISTLAAVMSDQQVSGYQSRARVALHAAEAGMSEVHASMSGATAPTINTASLADSSIYPHGLPSYGPDTAIADPVEDLGAVGAQGMNLRIGGGGPRYQVQFWRINVQGNAPGGSIARIEAAVGVLRGS